jgi:ornithine cyclodeaminase/alanine dehydrogenase-like protein (mu-crystallin family)
VAPSGVAREALSGRCARVLAGDAPGRESDEELTAFDSTGLAIRDLAAGSRS